jgi:subtilisin family serine protease
MFMNKIIKTIFFCFISVYSFGQNKYWVNFKDKDIQNYDYEKYLSAETIKNRKRFNLALYQYSDVPVNLEYIKTLTKSGIGIESKSRWFNSVSAFLTPDQLKQVSGMHFVASVEPVNRDIIITGSETNLNPENYHIAMIQMQSSAMLAKNLTGEGVTIGVIDAGFLQANSDRYLVHLFEEERIKGQRDFQDPSRKDIMSESATDADSHGTTVLQMISGYYPQQKTQTGLAVNSNFYLARTENGAREYRGEEDKWIEAIEWLDSLGVRLVNTSLGYAINMDDPKENYKPEEMNGKTTRISKAAQLAVADKGIFVVVSAGNEGSNPGWRIISSPADAEGVLSVGATRDRYWDKISYSSIGPEFLSYMKPNVSCFSPNGTSFSAPAVAGFVACLMQMDPNKSNKELKAIMEKSGHLYPYGNNFIGYGVPLASRAITLIENPDFKLTHSDEKHVSGSKVQIKIDKNLNADVVLFHKKNETIVKYQEIGTVHKGRLKIKRIPGIARTTVAFGQEVLEIIWD